MAMLMRTRRRRVVEEETAVVSLDISLCTLLKGIEQQEREPMKYEQNRLDSFDLSWIDYHHFDVSVAQRLARAGFYRRFDITECFSCRLLKPPDFWKEDHDPETVHGRERPNCEFITGQSDNVPIRNENGNINQVTRKSISLPNKSQHPMAGLESIVKTRQHLKLNENVKQIKKNTDSNSSTNQGDASKKINIFSPKLRPSSQTREPDTTPGTRKRRRLTSVSTTSTTSTENPDGIEKVSVLISFY